MKQTTLNTCITSLFLAGMTSPAVQASKPNIIFILADDLGYGDLSCYNPDSKIKTPNIDRIASEGMSFTDAHSGAALSTPTRYGVLTGRYAFRSKLKSGVLGTYADPLIEANRLTVGSFLQQNGYNTACIGKWHLGYNWPKNTSEQINFEESITGGPVDRGFDYYFGVDRPDTPPYCFIENRNTIGIPSIPKPTEMFGQSGVMISGWKLENLLPGISNRAVEYINNSDEIFKRDPEKPFFLYFALTAPHTPIAPAEGFIGSSEAHRYGDFVQQIDWEIGRVLKALDDQGLKENTLIIFTSDNGPMPWDGTNMQGVMNSLLQYGHNPSYVFRGKKSDIWEAGHRVPFIARWPEQIPANTKNDEIISLVDFMGTCAGILGETLPEGAGEDSYNLLPVLTAQNYDRPLRNALVNHSGKGLFALRQGDWKLILGGGSGGFTNPQTEEAAAALGWPPIQLYNLANDIGEKNNLQAFYPDKIIEMTAILDSIKRGKVINPSGSIYADNILEFDATDTNSYIDCGAQQTYMPDNFTIELWANFTASGGTILSTGASSATLGNQGYTLRLNTNNNKVEFTFGISTGTWQVSSSSGAVSLNTWTHIAIVYNRSSVQMYLNGVDNGLTEFTSPMSVSSQKLYIGEHPSFSNRRITGQLSDIRIWNTAKSQTDIKATMYGFLNGNEPGLVANWKLNEGSGTNIYDLTMRFHAIRKTGTRWVVNTIHGDDDETRNNNIVYNPVKIWPTMVVAGEPVNIQWNPGNSKPVVRLYSSTGQLIDTPSVNDDNIGQINTAKLKQGLYFVHIVSVNVHQSEKIIVN